MGHQHSRTLPKCPNSLRQAILRDTLGSVLGHRDQERLYQAYKPSEAEKCEAKDDKFVENDLFNLIDSSNKIVDDFKMLRPKMTTFVLQSITPSGDEKIKERYRQE